MLALCPTLSFIYHIHRSTMTIYVFKTVFFNSITFNIIPFQPPLFQSYYLVSIAFYRKYCKVPVYSGFLIRMQNVVYRGKFWIFGADGSPREPNLEDRMIFLYFVVQIDRLCYRRGSFVGRMRKNDFFFLQVWSVFLATSFISVRRQLNKSVFRFCLLRSWRPSFYPLHGLLFWS